MSEEEIREINAKVFEISRKAEEERLACVIREAATGVQYRDDSEDRALLAKALEALQNAVIPHQGNCDLLEIDWEGDGDPGCTCGLDELLASTAAQEALREREELLADRRRLELLMALHFTDRERIDESRSVQS